MHIKLPFLVILGLSVLQIMVYAIVSYEDFDDIVSVDPEQVSEIKVIDLNKHAHTIHDPQQIEHFLDYFRQFEYVRLLNDETSYMPLNTMNMTMTDGENIDFLIPYNNEIMINHKVYQIKNGEFKHKELLGLLD